MRRRTLLASMVAAAGSVLAPVPAPLAQEGKSSRRLPWRNWSGSQQCLPQSRLAPASIPELQELITSSSGVIRPVGSGHSFTPLVPTDGTLVSLARMHGLVSHNPDNLQATLWGGTRLGDIGQPLEDAGQAMIVMPDIDEQGLAGSLATATHGTGAGLGAIHSYVTGLQLMTAEGQLIDCDAQRNPEIFKAAQVSLGALGLVTQVTLQNSSPFSLRLETRWRKIDEILESADALAQKHRNFEFFFIPFSGMGFTQTMDETDEAPGTTEQIDQNDGTYDLKLARDYLQNWPKLRELLVGGAVGLLDDEVAVKSSWKNYAHERNVRFNEMEYHLPRENGLAALKEIIQVLEARHREVFFPIEVRYVKADDAWLSPFYQRDCCSIAVHRYFEEDYRPYFKTVEPILRKHGGRPHWGKINSLGRADFRALYPRWDDFTALRRQLDPKGRFLNSYLSELFAA